MNVITRLEKRSLSFWGIVGLILVVLVGVVDVLTGYELALSLFYLLPISLTTWFSGRRLGVLTSFFSAVVWFSADVITEHPYSHAAIPYWNTAIRFGFFMVTTLLLAALKKAYETQKELARIDKLTGAVNRSFFSELVQMEINRTRRFGHPFTLAYLDLDNFKAINDRFGHNIGDKVLYTIAQQAMSQLKNTDVVARLGGDEFAFLLPETDPTAAQVVISRVHSSLLEEMRRNNWSVTFSMGVLTCIDMPRSTDELIKQADDLMYSVKNAGKNSIRYSVHAG